MKKKDIPLKDYIGSKGLSYKAFSEEQEIPPATISWWSRNGAFVRGDKIMRPEKVVGTLK